VNVATLRTLHKAVNLASGECDSHRSPHLLAISLIGKTADSDSVVGGSLPSLPANPRVVEQADTADLKPAA
jgi:hypothetical protein